MQRRVLRIGDAPGGNYEPAVEMLMEQIMNTIDATGIPTHSFAEIAHDDWCALLANRGLCNCNPDVRVVDTVFGNL